MKLIYLFTFFWMTTLYGQDVYDNMLRHGPRTEDELRIHLTPDVYTKLQEELADPANPSIFRFLYISSKKVNKLPPIIEKYTKLKVLILGMPLKEIPSELFKLKTLNIISSRVCNQKALNEDWSQLENLEKFSVEIPGTKFTTLPSSLAQCNKLWSIDLWGFKGKIPLWLYSIKSLRNLSIINSGMHHLDTIITCLGSQLTILDLEGNKFNEIPNPVFTFTGLHTLSMRNNKITDISPSINKLVNLELLNLDDNMLTGLPEEIKDLPKLRFISLRDNKLLDTEKEKIKSKYPNIKIEF